MFFRSARKLAEQEKEKLVLEVKRLQEWVKMLERDCEALREFKIEYAKEKSIEKKRNAVENERLKKIADEMACKETQMQNLMSYNGTEQPALETRQT